MLITFLMLATAGANPQHETVCAKLMKDFEQNEITYALIRESSERMVSSSQQYAEATGDYAEVRKWMSAMSAEDREFKEKGDRLTDLMIGRKCELPDHVTSHRTYRDACREAKGASNANKACVPPKAKADD